MFDLKESPIRKNVANLKEGQFSIFEEDNLFEEGTDSESVKKYQVKTVLKDVENMLTCVEQNRNKKIKIAIMGEVKAGKSTFINTCVGKEVAYTDILEATAIVSEIIYAKEEYARVYGMDENVVYDFSFEQLLDWMAEKVDNMDDFSEFTRIEIGVNNPLLENITLVDTPGLLSITSANHEVTNKYIMQTDYILWVINSKTLGSKDVNDFIAKTKLTGKPLIGIINKVDTSDVLQEIQSYVQREYENIFEEIFFVSSLNAWEMCKEGATNWKAKTGFDEVLDCIEELSEDKDYSSQKTQYYQLQREKEIHGRMSAIIRSRKKYYDRELETFAAINKEMKKTVLQELKHWANNEFYMSEKEKLLSAPSEEFVALAQQYASATYFTERVDEKYNEIANFIYRKWEQIEHRIATQASEVIIDFHYDKHIGDIGIEISEEEMRQFTAEGAQRGMKKGALLGVAFAGYSAWLGPVAATATFIGELIPAVIPLAIAGIIIGAWSSKSQIDVKQVEANAKKKQEYIDGLYKEARRTLHEVAGELEKTLFACTDYYYKERCKFYKEKTEQVNFDFTEPAYGAFMDEMEQYMQSLEEAIKEVKMGEVPLPPKMQDE